MHKARASVFSRVKLFINKQVSILQGYILLKLSVLLDQEIECPVLIGNLNINRNVKYSLFVGNFALILTQS